jgi:hypothetical protein
MKMSLEYTFEKTSGGAYQVRLQGEFICYIMEKDSSKVDELLKEAGFTSREDFLNFCFNSYSVKEEIKMENKMSIEEKLAFIRRALELGANVDINLHRIADKELAKKAAAELSKKLNKPYQEKENDSTHWFKVVDWDNRLEVAIFYETYLEEDIFGEVEEIA